MNYIVILEEDRKLSLILSELFEEMQVPFKLYNPSDPALFDLLEDKEILGIFLNENLKDISSFNLFYLIKGQFETKDIPIIIWMQNQSQSDTVTRWLSMGAFFCLSKRFSKSTLSKLIDDLAIFFKTRVRVQKNLILPSYIIENASNFIIVLNRLFQVKIINQKARTFFDIQYTDIYSQSFDILKSVFPKLDNLEQFKRLLQSAIDSESLYFSFETQLEVNESQKYISWRVNIFKEDELEDFILYLHGTETTHKKELESEIKFMLKLNLEKNKELEHINETLMKQNEELNSLINRNETLFNLLQQYTPDSTWKGLVKAFDRGAAEIDREELEMTMVFGDVQNFTKFSERNPLDEVIGTLNELFTMVTHIIYRCEGDIDKFMGDAFFATFPDAQNAVIACHYINKQLDSLNDKRMEDGRTPLFIRMGVNTGKVIRGNIGGEQRKDNTIVGDAVNVAQRLETFGVPGQILISEHTYQLVKEIIITDEPTELQLKGRKKPILGYFVEGLKIEKPEIIEGLKKSIPSETSEDLDVLASSDSLAAFALNPADIPARP